jgi:Ca-activated chloride channel family protein
MSVMPSVILMNDADLPVEVPAHGERAEPGLGALRTERGMLPLESVELDATLEGLTGQLLLQQTFVNTHDIALEATYIFPLPERGAVQRFRMKIGKRLIEGELKERAAARREYREAIQQGHQAAITEEERPGVFTIRVGNIPPGERVQVHLEIALPLPCADGEVLFRFPLCVAPRYIPGSALSRTPVGSGTHADTDAVPDASRITPPVLLPGFPNPVALRIAVCFPNGSLRPQLIKSSLHAITEEDKSDALCLRIKPGERLNRDFILRYRLANGAIQTSVTLHPDEDALAGIFALTLMPPKVEFKSSKPRDVVLLLDHSGSMKGWKMVTARRACARIIEQLSDKDRFHILAFDSSIIEPIGMNWLDAATYSNRSKALQFLDTITADGGTEILPALDRGLNSLLSTANDTKREKSLVLITDGQVGNESQLLRQLGDRCKQVRIHALGIDRAVNMGFLQQLADISSGSCFLVESQEQLETVIDRVQRRLGDPVLQNLLVRADGIRIDEHSLIPARLPDLFAGAPVTIRGRYQGKPSATFVVSANTADGKPWSQSIPGVRQDLPALTTLWAKHRLRDLEDAYAIHPSHDTEQMIIGLSLKYQVLCKFTSFLAVDRSRVANPEGKQHQVIQPVEMPDQWVNSYPSPQQVDSFMSLSVMNLCEDSSPPLFSEARDYRSRVQACLMSKPFEPRKPVYAKPQSWLSRLLNWGKRAKAPAITIEQLRDRLKACNLVYQLIQPVIFPNLLDDIIRRVQEILEQAQGLGMPMSMPPWHELTVSLQAIIDLRAISSVAVLEVSSPAWQSFLSALTQCQASLEPAEAFWKG